MLAANEKNMFNSINERSGTRKAVFTILCLYMTIVFVCGCFIDILQTEQVEGRRSAIFLLCLLRMSKDWRIFAETLYLWNYLRLTYCKI